MRFTRDFYRPKDARVEYPEGLAGAEIHRYENGSRAPDSDVPFAAVFGGKRAEPDWHYRFKTDEQREEKIAGWIAAEKAHIESVAERRKERNKPHNFKVGDVFYASWGYDQTNIDFYKIVELKGKTMAKVVPIGGKTVSSNPPQEMVVADPDCIREYDVLLGVGREDQDKGKWKRLTPDVFSPSRGYHAGPDGGGSHYETSFGWGH